MKNKRLLLLIGVAMFLSITSLTYFSVAPVNNTTANTTLQEVTSETTNTTAVTTNENSIITNVYRTMTALITGGVISAVAIFFIKS
jgi:hypothetical protein